MKSYCCSESGPSFFGVFFFAGKVIVVGAAVFLSQCTVVARVVRLKLLGKVTVAMRMVHLILTGNSTVF